MSTRLRFLLRERDHRGAISEQVLSVYRDLGVVPKADRVDNFNKTPEDLSNYKLVVPGDVVVNKMKAWQGSIAVSRHRGIVSGDYLVCEVVGDVERRFLHHLLRSRPLIGEYRQRSKGIRPSQWRLYWEDLADIRVDLPSLKAQCGIADYLDSETARIDVLITKKRRLLELIEEGWSSRLCESLGGPDSWVPLKSVARFREGPGILTVDFRDEGTPLLRIGNLVEDTISLEGCGFLDPADVAIRWRHLVVHAGELLVSGSATSGLPVVVPPEAEGAVPYTGLIRIWPSNAALDRDYLRFFLASRLFTDQIDQLKTGIGLQHWGPSHLSQVKMPCPTLVKQRVVVESLIRLRNVVRKAQLAIQAQTDLLVEHRQALITAAVTGELSIPGVAA